MKEVECDDEREGQRWRLKGEVGREKDEEKHLKRGKCTKRNQAQQSVQTTTERSWAFTGGEKKWSFRNKAEKQQMTSSLIGYSVIQ